MYPLKCEKGKWRRIGIAGCLIPKHISKRANWTKLFSTVWFQLRNFENINDMMQIKREIFSERLMLYVKNQSRIHQNILNVTTIIITTKFFNFSIYTLWYKWSACIRSLT